MTELTIEETAKRLGVSPAALRKRIQRGKLSHPIVRRGRAVFVLWEDRADTSKDKEVPKEDLSGDKDQPQAVSQTVQPLDNSSVAVGMSMQVAIAQTVKDVLAEERPRNIELVDELREEIAQLTQAVRTLTESVATMMEQAATHEKPSKWNWLRNLVPRRRSDHQ